MCFFYEKLVEELSRSWRGSLVKLLRKKIGFQLMPDNLKYTLKTKEGIDVIDVWNEYYVVHFNLDKDKDKVINGEPWVVFDYYLYVQAWKPDVIPFKEKINRTMAWECPWDHKFWRKMRYVSLTMVVANGHSRGLWLLQEGAFYPSRVVRFVEVVDNCVLLNLRGAEGMFT
ncbi:hypothetical protein RJT34_29958 [Clitoria ternatea]|uniref:DUF4283 domain-containing protein n=1 Tax=Clitoria ternatea TaxID=43366 RepID=A0AAN9ES75_CLITE